MNRFAPGTPAWFDLGSPDVAASADFYSGLFGWSATVVSDPGAGGYTTFTSGGQLVAAVARHQIDTPYHRSYGPDNEQHGMPAIWTVYFATDDPEALTKRVEAAGGDVIMTPMDVLGLGRMAVFADPAGAAFAVWRKGMMEGAEVTGVPGSVGWVELVTGDFAGSRAFYPATLGLTPWDTGVPGVSDPVWQIGGTPVAGSRQLGVTGAVRPHWAVSFAVDDCDGTAQRAVALGGVVENEPADTPRGRRADLVDPHGAGFSVVELREDFPAAPGGSS
ncbi:VOC family protein [Streptomyces sp. CA-278952]|uniref:VOC family protein n=1 Tax=unclassified Streptomyces TaxID=2593676 RepID=UPI002242052F|nr:MULTISPECIES: VOC family protein [unclassified Streptomyces]UZI28585.1 VOC family protein [Streptomyces sp. VB1]WDG28523.1 VOC family protein [Streptomyces sp. CA-278952]